LSRLSGSESLETNFLAFTRGRHLGTKLSLLEDLYWSNLAPADKGCLNNSKLLEQINIAADTEEKLLELLDGEVKKLFDAFSEA
jgi:hypothetical protein